MQKVIVTKLWIGLLMQIKKQVTQIDQVKNCEDSSNLLKNGDDT